MSPIEQEPKHVHYSWRLKVCDLGSCSEVGLGEVRHLDGLRCALAGPESSILLTSLLLSCDHFTASLLSGDLSKGRDVGGRVPASRQRWRDLPGLQGE